MVEDIWELRKRNTEGYGQVAPEQRRKCRNASLQSPASWTKYPCAGNKRTHSDLQIRPAASLPTNTGLPWLFRSHPGLIAGVAR